MRRVRRGKGRVRRPEDQEVKRIKGREKGSDNQMIRLYREGQLGERQSAPDLEIFSIGDRVCQPNPITGKN